MVYLSAIQSRHSEANVRKDLYSFLVRPAIVGNEQKLRLIIVPDGKLHILPFDAARILKGDDHLLLGSNATEAAFKSLPVADFRVLHFAVHGIADPAFPDRAALVLGSSPASGEDGLL
jgi:hypothetical protein